MVFAQPCPVFLKKEIIKLGRVCVAILENIRGHKDLVQLNKKERAVLIKGLLFA